MIESLLALKRKLLSIKPIGNSCFYDRSNEHIVNLESNVAFVKQKNDKVNKPILKKQRNYRNQVKRK